MERALAPPRSEPIAAYAIGSGASATWHLEFPRPSENDRATAARVLDREVT
jgi:hypothetical protein